MSSKASYVYVASSWRNEMQPAVVHALVAAGFEVYDFRNPRPGLQGFQWSSIDPNWQTWSVKQYARALESEPARVGHEADMEALNRADACVLLLPSGRSASWEFGYAMAMKKRCVVYMPERCEPELMYRGAFITDRILEVVGHLAGVDMVEMNVKF